MSQESVPMEAVTPDLVDLVKTQAYLSDQESPASIPLLGAQVARPVKWELVAISQSTQRAVQAQSPPIISTRLVAPCLVVVAQAVRAEMAQAYLLAQAA
jgi:hypothetical protein